MGDVPANRLVHEKSPYLLQHARNPVDWYPWGDEAFAAARERDCPVFLSIGYATCHWCHVMEKESFEDEAVAGLLNDAFVNIKVDREERPDIDGIYMTAAQMMVGQGGWPLTIVMTPDRRPFFATTYVPRESRFGRVGMLELVPRLREAWDRQRDQVLSSAATMQDHLQRISDSDQRGRALDASTLGDAFRELAGEYDRSHGGFGSPTKFPTPHRLLFLLRYWRRTDIESARTMVDRTLSAMRAGGIFDQVGFGFHRYSTDRRWLLPHFEKMLYDQAMLALAYTEAWQAGGSAEHARTAREVLTYVLRDLTSPEGAFYSAEDADSEGKEGKFYVWTHAELRSVLGEADAGLAEAAWDIRAEGNFDDEATRERTGANVLHLARPLLELAADLDLPAAELEERLESLRARLYDRRAGRVRPLLDDKILTDWNGLMIAALARAGRALGESSYVEAARRAADFLHGTMWLDGDLRHRYRDGEAAIASNLDDYACLAWGEIELHQATLDPQHLGRALRLTEVMLEKFLDEERGGLYFSPAGRDDLIVRRKEVYDGAVPSGNSVAMYNLARLARLTGEARYESLAAGIAAAFSRQIAAHPSAFAFLLSALGLALGSSEEIVIVGERDAQDTEALLEVARAGYHPDRVLLWRPPGDDPGRVGELAPFAAGFVARDGRATAYACRDFRCEQPVTDPEALRALLETSS